MNKMDSLFDIRMHWTVHLEGGPRRVNHAAVAVNDKIYSFGGYCTGENYRNNRPMDIHVLNTENYRWRRLPVSSACSDRSLMPFIRYGHTAVAYGDMIYIWGGRNDKTACNSLFGFDTTTLKWVKPPVSGVIPGARDGHSACVIDHFMYIFGGFEDEIDRFSQEVYTLDLLSMTWDVIDTKGVKPIYRDFHTATAIGNRMYVFGGRGDENGPYHTQMEVYCNNIMYLDTSTNVWHLPNVTGKPPVGRRSHSAFFYNNHLYIFGGYNGLYDDHFNDLHQFSVESNKWDVVHTQGRPPCKRRRQSCLIVCSKLFLFGGTSPILEPQIEINIEHNAMYEQKLMDHNDLHVLDFAPTLLVLSLIAILEAEPKQPLPPWLPPSLKWWVSNMTTNNNISDPIKYGSMILV